MSCVPSSKARWTDSAGDGAPAHLDRARMAAGPLSVASAELPLPAKLLGLCDYRNPTLWGRARWLDGAETNLPLPSLGRPGPRPGTMNEVFSVNDSKNLILAVVLSALVLLGW